MDAMETGRLSDFLQASATIPSTALNALFADAELAARVLHIHTELMALSPQRRAWVQQRVVTLLHGEHGPAVAEDFARAAALWQQQLEGISDATGLRRE